MALEESPTPLGELNVQAREAHLLRTRGRIDYWRGQLAGEPSDGLKSLALEELGKYERQLREPLTARRLKTLPQAAPSVMERMMATLRQEVEELKAKLTSKPAAVEESVKPAEESAVHGS